jgi:hypothetical protein
LRGWTRCRTRNDAGCRLCRERRIRRCRALLLDAETERWRHDPTWRWSSRRFRSWWRFDNRWWFFSSGWFSNRLDGRHGRFGRDCRPWFNHRLFDRRWRRLDRRQWFGLCDRRRDRDGRLRGLHETRRRKNRCGWFRRLGCFLRRPALLALGGRRLSKDVAGRKGDIPLPRQAIDKLPRHDLLDRARRALHLDAVIALQEGNDLLTRGVEELGDLVNPDCCHSVCFRLRRLLVQVLTARLGR